MFNVSTSLDIKSSNSPVWAVVNAFNQDNAVPTKVRIHTSNRSVPSHFSPLFCEFINSYFPPPLLPFPNACSPLHAELALISTHEDKTSGVFFVDTRTSNSPLTVNFTEQAPDALLKLRAHTSNSPAYVRLHPS